MAALALKAKATNLVTVSAALPATAARTAPVEGPDLPDPSSLLASLLIAYPVRVAVRAVVRSPLPPGQGAIGAPIAGAPRSGLGDQCAGQPPRLHPPARGPSLLVSHGQAV